MKIIFPCESYPFGVIFNTRGSLILPLFCAVTINSSSLVRDNSHIYHLARTWSRAMANVYLKIWPENFLPCFFSLGLIASLFLGILRIVCWTLIFSAPSIAAIPLILLLWLISLLGENLQSGGIPSNHPDGFTPGERWNHLTRTLRPTRLLSRFLVRLESVHTI